MAKSIKRIKLWDKEFALSYPNAEIQRDIATVAEGLNQQYRDTPDIPLFLCMLNGAFMFAADLLKKIDFQCEVSFVKFASYQGTKSQGTVNQLIGLNHEVKNRAVVIVEDIVESGTTLTTLIAQLKEQQPKSVEVATMLFKPNCFKGTIKLNYIGRSIPDDFIVGYGLDYEGLGRNLPDIYTLA